TKKGLIDCMKMIVFILVSLMASIFLGMKQNDQVTRKENKQKRRIKFLFFSLLLLFMSACNDFEIGDISLDSEKEEEVQENTFDKSEISDSDLKVHYINVGQGDSTFIDLPNGENVLIDGATRSNGQTVLDYLDRLNVKKIDYLIATHPHEDHIGGLVEVVKNYDIGKIYMPEKEHTTIVFEDLLLAIKEKGYSITKAEAGDILFEEEGLSMNIIAPEGITGENLNEYSVANRLVFGETSFLFTGDAEKKSEENMVNSDYNLEADVLKVGHHGGDTSSKEDFLTEVKADYGIISAGEDNQYGHPHSNVMERLRNHGMKIFRTDKDGTIIAVSDGENIEFNKKATEISKTSSTSSGNRTGEVEVYRTDTGGKYHLADCHTLEDSKVAIPLDEAQEEGLEACGICNPPE
ncbi:MAG: MBL fold metallo-hydrolase, partial [Atopostipes sp.]|nr:MBL fold metallo-hydrolase [Atopostipes sp.]